MDSTNQEIEQLEQNAAAVVSYIVGFSLLNVFLDKQFLGGLL